MQSNARDGADHLHASDFSGYRSGMHASTHLQSDQAAADNKANAGWPPHAPSPDPSDPFAGHFSPYGDLNHAAQPGYGQGDSAPRQEGPVSPLHVTLIALILLVGLAIGVGRSWWIDERLEAISAKNSAPTTLHPEPTMDAPSSSIQSSIDRAYIPPLFSTEDVKPSQDKHANLAIDPGTVNEATQPSAELPAQSEPAPTPQAEQVEPPQEPPAIREEAPVKKPAASRQEKKRKSVKTTSSSKLASADKKERLSEIERVRTQAFSETSKDRVGGKKSNSSESTVGPQSERRNTFRANKVAQHTVTRSQYARCERIDHIIRREKCKWDLCNHQWGKGACPSFKHEKPFLF